MRDPTYGKLLILSDYYCFLRDFIFSIIVLFADILKGCVLCEGLCLYRQQYHNLFDLYKGP
jgi:hypothetical protein